MCVSVRQANPWGLNGQSALLNQWIPGKREILWGNQTDRLDGDLWNSIQAWHLTSPLTHAYACLHTCACVCARACTHRHTDTHNKQDERFRPVFTTHCIRQLNGHFIHLHWNTYSANKWDAWVYWLWGLLISVGKKWNWLLIFILLNINDNDCVCILALS